MLIAVSTVGQGDFPANARALWRKLLRKKLSALQLEHVLFAIFGLGDSSYPKYVPLRCGLPTSNHTRFNWAARKLNKRLVQLGATEFFPLGEGDEQHEEG